MKRLAYAALLAFLSGLVSCGGGEGGSDDGGGAFEPPQTFSIGGTVTGLTGTLVLQLNGGSNLTLTASDSFTFSTRLADGSPYTVSVLTQPAGQNCTVANAIARIARANVTNVFVVCGPSTQTFTVGGSVTGLTGTLVLQNNGGDDLTLTASGAFTFPTGLANGFAYNVSVLTQPAGQTCTVTNGSGTIPGAAVSTVNVVCASAPMFTVGGGITGLSGTLVLQLNGGSNLTLTGNGPFTFSTNLANGSAYTVTVSTPPSGQTCAVSNGSGTIAGAAVTNVNVVCSTVALTVGGTVTGLSGTLVLQLNGGNNLTLTANGAFTFSSALANGSAYSISVLTQPAGQTCTITSGSGTIAAANVTNVSIACSSASALTLGAWTSRAPMPTSRHAVGLAVVAGRLYAIGGFGVSGQVGTNEEYDPAANTWRSRNPLPSTATDFAGTNAAVVNDTIYMIGGNASGFCTSAVRAYHPASDTWSTRASMPTARCHLAVVALNGLIYAIGGTNTQGSTNFTTVEVYNPATNTWSSAAPMLTGRSVFGAGVASGRIHVFGGSGASATSHESYDPATNQWTSRPGMPTVRNGAAVAEVNGLLYVAGGVVASQLFATVEAFDPARNTWHTMPSMPTRRQMPGAAVLNGAMYVIGGHDGNAGLASNEVFNAGTGVWSTRASSPTKRRVPAVAALNGLIYTAGGAPENVTSSIASVETYNPVTNTWATAPSMPNATQQAAGATIGGLLYVAGGGTCCGPLADLQAFDTATTSWTVKPGMQTPRYNPAAAVLNGKLYVAGGGSGQGAIYGNLDQYDPVTNAWTVRAPMPTPRAGLGLGVVNGVLYAVGGANLGGPLATVEAYDPVTNSWTARAPMRIARSNAAVSVINGILYAAGGTDSVQSLSTVEAYNPAHNTWTTVPPLPAARGWLDSDVVNGVMYAVGSECCSHFLTVDAFTPGQ